MFDSLILKSLLETVEKFADNDAFCINGGFHTYNEFGLHISKIRKSLQSFNLKNKNIGLVANDDIETYASIFAIWLEGMAYVPLHPKHPVERSLEIISLADIDLIINSASNNTFSSMATIESAHLQSVEMNLQPKLASEDDLAYILFTSGSTGKPKGVKISRGNIGAFINSFWKTPIQIDENDRCLQCFDLTFDVSVQSYLAPLCKGACIYTIPHDQIKYSYVYGLLEDQKLTFCIMAPSMLHFLRPYFDEIDIDSVRYCILTAEASPVDLIKEWSICIPNAEIFDFYGPTEATIYCTYAHFNRDGENKQLNGMLSIGKAMHGLNTIVIDSEKNTLNLNQKGELCISGDQLTPGYWKNKEKNRESFFKIEFCGKLTRFYKTGDSCYFDEEGDIMLAGRLDYQVKIQGYRIELGEIEYHARECLGGQNTVAVTFENTTRNTEILLFVEGELEDLNVLLDYLKSKMPFYMIPSKVIVEKEFPINTSGKVDRNILKKMIKI